MQLIDYEFDSGFVKKYPFKDSFQQTCQMQTLYA